MTVPVILFVLGLIVGSFLNVVGLRLNSGISLGGRSSCHSCGKTLKWYELIPIFSFIFLRGRCKDCHARISPQYPLIELWTGLIFMTVPYIAISVFCIYVAITIYDVRHKIIPDSLVYIAIFLSIAVRSMSGGSDLDWLAGPILFLFFALVWLLSSGRAMGFGDAKLALSIGLLLGAPLGFSAIILAFWIGAAVGMILLLKRAKDITMKSELPFAPFMILGAWLSIILGLDLLHVSLF